MRLVRCRSLSHCSRTWHELFRVAAGLLKAMSEVTRNLAAVERGDAHGLEADEPESAAVVKRRFFARLTAEQSAVALGVSVRAAKRRWA
jgi:ECF sigma factor